MTKHVTIETTYNTMQTEEAIQKIQTIFGMHISYTLRLPKSGDDMLIRSDVPVMHNNAATGERKSIVKISDSDRQNATNHQLAFCLGNLYMKMEGGALYIKTESPILLIDSPVDDQIIQEFVTNTYMTSEKAIVTSTEEEAFIEAFFGVSKDNMQPIQDRLFVRPLVENKALKDILAHQTINDPLASSYRGLFMGSGACIFPHYTNNKDTVEGQLIVSTDKTLVI